jgi:hypothetical protein
LHGQNGASLIVIVVMIIVIGIIAAAFVSLIDTEVFTAMNQSAGLLTFGVAEGGVEFEQHSLAQNLSWYRSASDPMPASARTLGAAPNAGSFTVQTNLPGTRLRRRIPNGISTADICVYTTDRFTPPAGGYLLIADIGADPFEFVQYAGVGTSPNCNQLFTGIVRDRTIGGITYSGGASPHDRGEFVYPVTTIAAGETALPNNCVSGPASFRIVDHPKFLTAGAITIFTDTNPGSVDWEEITYTNSTRAGGVMTLYGVRRCQNGTTTTVSHPAGKPVTPILPEGNPPDYQAEVVSTGTVAGVLGASTNAVRVIRKTVQR